MIVNRDIATSAAAEHTPPSLKKALNTLPASSKLREDALIPIFGIRRPSRIVRRVGSRKPNGFFTPITELQDPLSVSLWISTVERRLPTRPYCLPKWLGASGGPYREFRPR